MENKKISGFTLIEILVTLTILAVIAIYMGTRLNADVKEDKFYKTCYLMEDIKEAIIGKSGYYCNGVRQFTGYVSDTGNLPDLLFRDKDETYKVTCSNSGIIKAVEGENGLAWALKNDYRPQPKALWSKPELMPEWSFHKKGRIWAGWRGPYIDLPYGDALRDAWGNKFIFVVGEVVGLQDEEDEDGQNEESRGKTYRCKKSYRSIAEAVEPGQVKRAGEFGSEEYWEVMDEGPKPMNFRIWKDVGTEEWDDDSLSLDIVKAIRTKEEIFYGEGCLTIISLGADNSPGGKGLDKDISLIIEPAEYQGEIAGNAGNNAQFFAQEVCLYYPDYTSDKSEIEKICITQLENNSILYPHNDPLNDGDVYTGIIFRFGAGNTCRSVCTKWECSASDGSSCECIEWEQSEEDCIAWKCKCNDSTWGCWTLPGNCTCTECVEGYGEPPGCFFNNDYWYITAACNSEPGSDSWWSCECSEYSSEEECVKWECDSLVENGGYECVEHGREEYNINVQQKNIPIGIRSLMADSCFYTVAVSPGGNWIGTVHGN